MTKETETKLKNLMSDQRALQVYFVHTDSESGDYFSVGYHGDFRKAGHGKTIDEALADFAQNI